MTFLLGMGLGSLITIGFAFLVTAGDDDIDNSNN
jgi:hypothetical protein